MINHNFTTDINVAASLHFLASVPNAFIMEYCVEPSEISRSLAKEPDPDRRRPRERARGARPRRRARPGDHREVPGARLTVRRGRVRRSRGRASWAEPSLVSSLLRCPPSRLCSRSRRRLRSRRRPSPADAAIPTGSTSASARIWAVGSAASRTCRPRSATATSTACRSGAPRCRTRHQRPPGPWAAALRRQNRSDDLFIMYVKKRQITGLEAHAVYAITAALHSVQQRR